MVNNRRNGNSTISRRTLLKSGTAVGTLGFILPALAGDAAGATQTITVDFGVTDEPVSHRASGTLYGITADGSTPADAWIEPMNPVLFGGGGARLSGGGWANGGQSGYDTRWNMVENHYNRVTQPNIDAEYFIKFNDLWGADSVTVTGDDPFPGDNGDWSSYESFVQQIVSDINAAGMDRSVIQYEIWNEPDLDMFWPRSTTQYYEMWERGVNLIQSLDPNARINGPGVTHYERSVIEDWLDMTITTGTEPDILNWHDLQTGDDAVDAANEIRGLLADRGLTDVSLQINEYVPANNQSPGYTAWDLCRVEKSGVKWASLANWDYCCDGGALAGTLTEDGTQPTGRWWLYCRYGQMTGDMVPTARSSNIDSIANLNPPSTQSRIIVGNNGTTGDIDVTLQNVDQISSNKIRVKVERSPELSPLSAPEVAQDYVTNVSGSDHTVGLSWNRATDAYVITVTQASAPIADGVYRIEATHSGKVADVNQSSTSDGATVHQWEWLGGDNQRWIATNVRDNVYTFENVNSGKFLDVDEISMANGADVHQWTGTGAANQEWYVEETANGEYRLEAVHSGKVLDVAGGLTSDGANVHQWIDRSESQQRWQFIAA